MESVDQNSEYIKDELANELARLVIHRYTSLQPKYKVQDTEWTVLAGVVAHNAVTKERLVVCVATGTKCLADATSVNGYLVRDCHAETLCRRALIRVLLDDIELIQNDKSEKAKLLERDETKGGSLIRLKQNIILNLIISDSPCGCASDFPRLIAEDKGLGSSNSVTKPSSVIESEIDEQGCAEDKQSQLGNPRISGAKRLQLEKDNDNDDLRTKPGRSDLPLERRTRSMSCADKLMRWQHLGLQGSLLSLLKLEEPIRYHSIILLRDAAMTCVDGDATTSNLDMLKKASGIVLHALERSFARDASLSSHHRPHFFVADQVGFSNSRQQICPAQFGKEKSHSAGKATWWAVNGEQESLTGVRGVKEGASKAANPATVCSSLCKARLLARVLQLLPVDQDPDHQKKSSYREWKQMAVSYRSNVDVFRDRFKSWNGNERYDEFSL